ncbi:ABC transporter substrate-binding protein [Nereida sp. MMG025]|uniref:ABC transporter substrate-binding protein n=1 Tax=Nereida sp. MMG025 TaxID=2909981 RepID=UPI001F175458|nr:ABC transporter substrate-binding protein [Nereida sp. MMG025]MCF6443212.1 ABC transporter substrate-binding protein [Nereida sp. MMG025]
MTLKTQKVHSAAEMFAKEHLEGKMDRREFMTRVSALGVATATAYSLIGANPAEAAGHSVKPSMGGTLRIQQEVRALKDPRAFDWSQMANITRGICEYLIEYQRDGSFKGILLESWEANEDATQYTLNVRQGVKFNNGDDLTAEHVAANFVAWADKNVEGNSMASRVAALVDEETGMAREGAIEVVDDYTVRLNLTAPDITIVPGIADYPSAVQHKDMIGQDIAEHGIGTGAYKIESYDVGVKAVLVKNEDHDYWGETYLDRVEFIDLGTDPAAWVAGAEADEFDMVYESVGDFVSIFDSIGWNKSEVVTAATVVIRPNQKAEVDGMMPYADKRVRQAIMLAVDNNVPLELGIAGQGIVAENHHVAPVHPEYAELPPLQRDVEKARALMEEAGMMDFEHEIISIDDDYRRNTTDAVAAQLRDAGFKVKRTVIPGATFWNDWTKYPFSSTNWNHRELGVQILALAYKSGEAWNEAGFENAEFDALLAEAVAIADADARREVMAKLQAIMQDEGVTIQPYWRSLFRHYKDGIVNAEMHPKFEINVHNLGFA